MTNKEIMASLSDADEKEDQCYDTSFNIFEAMEDSFNSSKDLFPTSDDDVSDTYWYCITSQLMLSFSFLLSFSLRR